MGQDRRPGRRRRRARAGARPLAGAPSRRRSTSSCRATGACPCRRDRRRSTALRVPDPSRPVGATRVTIVDVAADGYRLRLVDHPAAFDRDGFYGDAAATTPTTPGGSGCSAGRRSRRCAPRARPVDVLHLHDWHAGPGRDLPRRAATPTTRSSAGRPILMTLHNLAYHGWTPRDARSASSGLRRATASSPADADGRRPARARASSGPSSSTPSRPASPREALTPGVRDGPRRRSCGRRATGSSASSTGSTRPSGTRPRTRTSPRPTRAADLAGKAACRARPPDPASGSTRRRRRRSSG